MVPSWCTMTCTPNKLDRCQIPGGALEDCRVLAGVMFQKDVVAPGRMRRKIHNPRILLLDCPLEYKKGENQTNVELTREEDWCGSKYNLLKSCTYCTRPLYHMDAPTLFQILWLLQMSQPLISIPLYIKSQSSTQAIVKPII